MFEEFLSRVSMRTHENGMKIVLVKDPGSKVFDASIVVGSGADHDPVCKSGIAHFVEHMCYRSNLEMTEEELKRKFQAGSNANFFSFTTYDCTVHTVACHKEGDNHIDFLRTLFRCVSLPLFKSKEVAVAKDNLIKEVTEFLNQPFNSNYYRLLHRLDAAGECHSEWRCPAGNVSNIEQLTKDELCEWHLRNYVSENMTLIIHGDVDDSVFEVASQFITFYIRKGNKPDPVEYCFCSDVPETTEVTFGVESSSYIGLGWRGVGTMPASGENVCDYKTLMTDAIIEKMVFDSDGFRFSGHGQAGGHICRTIHTGWIVCGSVINGHDPKEIEAAKQAMLDGIAKAYNERTECKFKEYKEFVLTDLNRSLHSDHVVNMLFKVFVSGDGNIENWLRTIQQVEASDVWNGLHDLTTIQPLVSTTICKSAV